MPESVPPPNDSESPGRRPATLLELISAVFWSFFGVRKGKAMRRDAIAIRPHQVIIVGIVLAAVLVVLLLTLVRVILRAAGA